MNLSNEQLANELLDALSEFDRLTGPLGLYACEEFRAKEQPFPRLHQEWHLCLKPRLKSLGYETGSRRLQSNTFHYFLPGGARAQLKLVRLSKIKVRKFGSAYRMDNHQKYQERWNELRLDHQISEIWKSPKNEMWDCRYSLSQTPSQLARFNEEVRLFLFIGFAREPEPFGKELSAMQEQLQWELHGVSYGARSWPDRYDRGFYVRLSAWSRREAALTG